MSRRSLLIPALVLLFQAAADALPSLAAPALDRPWSWAGAQAVPLLPLNGDPVQVELVSEAATVSPGQPFWIGVRLVMDPGWHVYWKNPGDSGLPTTVELFLPAGWKADPLQWPVPSRFPYSGVMTYGYAGEILLMARITPGASARGTAAGGSSVTLRARAGWLACKEECIPGNADLELRLPVGENAAPDVRRETVFAFARARSMLPEPAASAAAFRQGKRIVLDVTGLSAEGDAYFFSEQAGVVDSSKAQVVERGASGIRLLMDAADAQSPGRLSGILAVGSRGYAVDAQLQDAATAAGRSGAAAGGISLLLAVVFAFLGGLILNLMPCVLPVLSLKVLGFVRQAHAMEAGAGGKTPGIRGALAHGLSFTAGVLVMFWALLGALLAARAGGSLLGWGFQFQSPGFVAAMALVIFVLGLNMLGVFELGSRLQAAGAGLSSRKGLLGSFFTGFIAVIVSTPCTAPFMGSALGFALTQPAPAAFAVFTALAIGMAAPSLVFSASPRLLALVPKLGRWMESLRQAMGFLMMAVVVWLCSLIAPRAGGTALTLLLGGLAAAAFGAWIWGRWGSLDRGRASRIVSACIAAALVVTAFFVSVRGAQRGQADRAAAAGAAPAREEAAGAPGTWQPYSDGKLAALRARGVPVFIDFGAAWCLTCIVNERIALDSPAVREAMEENGVVSLRADWTDRNDDVARALASYGRSGVPLYVLYGPGASQPVILPEILTPGIVIDTLRRTMKADN